MKKLQVYLANLAVGNIKLHNLHWNLQDLMFVPVHEHLEELYDDAFEKMDQVAELMKMQGQTPLSSLKDYLEAASIEELDKTSFRDKEALEISLDYVKTMRFLALEIRQEAEDNFQVSNMMEEHIEGYDKEIWFLESILA